ncbi:MAG: hypothetical protein ACKER6_01400 [Candidatus Hodgkinia cicadicola]
MFVKHPMSGAKPAKIAQMSCNLKQIAVLVRPCNAELRSDLNWDSELAPDAGRTIVKLLIVK